jgi:pyrroloquinoline quinone biosynthesis protein B
LAVELGAHEWLVIDATSDVERQIEDTPDLHPGPGVRQTPVRRVLLTDAQIDHVIGLLSLRQADELEVLAPSPVVDAMHDALPLARALAGYQRVRWTRVPIGERVTLTPSAVSVCAVVAGTRPPRYIGDGGPAPWSVAYEIIGAEGRSCLYAPVVAELSEGLMAAASRADCVLVDGTFWHQEEPARTGAGTRTARDMGHVPISGDGGSLPLMSTLGATHRLYTHINNTNPVVDPRSEESLKLRDIGVGVAFDGQELML